MEVVDGRGPVILCVPAEGREAHADVQPGDLHARNVHVDAAQDRVGDDRQVVQVPIGLKRNSNFVSC